MRASHEDDGDQIPLLARWVLAGLGWQVAYSGAYDHDLGAVLRPLPGTDT